MQRATTAETARTHELTRIRAIACPVCGAAVRGIAATRPGEHRFVGCDHYASGRFIRRSADGDPGDGGGRCLGP